MTNFSAMRVCTREFPSERTMLDAAASAAANDDHDDDIPCLF